MNTTATYAKQFNQAALRQITKASDWAYGAIDAYRDIGTRLHDAAEQRWNRAFQESGPKLSAETRKNAQHAKQVFSRRYNQGLSFTTEAAESAVDVAAEVARSGAQRATAFAKAMGARFAA